MLTGPCPISGTFPCVILLHAHDTSPHKAYWPHFAGEETEAWATQQVNDGTESRAQAFLMPGQEFFSKAETWLGLDQTRRRS